LGRAAVRKLIELTESTADRRGAFITLEDVTTSWKMKGFYRLFPKVVGVNSFDNVFYMDIFISLFCDTSYGYL